MSESVSENVVGAIEVAMMEQADNRIPVLVVISPIVSGVVSWAIRVREAFANDDKYQVVLVSSRGVGDGAIAFDHAVNSPSEFKELLRKYGSGIVVPNYAWHFFTPICSEIADGSSWRILGYCRADSEDEYYQPLLQRASVISHFVCVSEQCRTKLAEYLPDRAGSLTTLPTGVVVPTHIDKGKSHKLNIVYAGRLRQHQKRVLDIAIIAHRLEERGVDFLLTIVGDGDEEAILKQCMDSLEGTKVVFMGRVHPSEMKHVWSSADVGLLCSEFEGTSNSLLESMAYGCIPVVTHTDSGVDGIVCHGNNGFLFEVGDIANAVDILQDLADDAEKRIHYNEAALKSAQPYSIERHVKTLKGVFDVVTQCPICRDGASSYARQSENASSPAAPETRSLWQRARGKIGRAIRA
ncbi:glycosyltransferase involved in cell wall biosynthesis [Rhodopirellula rubra]|uniref:Glycosyltransferase involved in cell wall biosynthesis n=1 Tax=Aporhodopirellula rubra TaxID=980271 RepID=A0A7W5DXD4_9BACT|nr:glycosyltransferase family 4 protein [Aporhodopirellula rubra]MBB3206276.1 glycosyltransferase involved in cell wall biosynthesis [Aporhodopirellula rubra]